MSPPATPPTVLPGPTPAASEPAAPKPSFFRRRIVAPITAQLTQGITPNRIAFTLGLGVALALFPFLGFTTILCFAVAAALKLNQPIIQILNQLMWPVWIPMVAVYIKVGAAIYGAPAMPFDPVEVSRLFLTSQGEFWAKFGMVGVHAFTAWILSVPLITGITYYATRPALRRLAAALNRRA
jgi:uncharacterized protein (DUF2062 family)